VRSSPEIVNSDRQVRTSRFTTPDNCFRGHVMARDAFSEAEESMDRDAASLSPDLVARLFDTSSHLTDPDRAAEVGEGARPLVWVLAFLHGIVLSLPSHHGVFSDTASHEITISCIYRHVSPLNTSMPNRLAILRPVNRRHGISSTHSHVTKRGFVNFGS
jgi:hypothetical protein